MSEPEIPILFSQLTVRGGGGATDTIYPTHAGLDSETADNLALSHYFDSSSTPRPKVIEEGLARISYQTLSSSQPLHLSIARARAAASASQVPFIVVAGRGRRDAISHSRELAAFLKANLEAVQSGIAGSTEVRRSLGDLGVAYLVSGVGNGVLVVQKAGGGGRVKDKGV